MARAILFDTETTGLQDARLIEAAWGYLESPQRPVLIERPEARRYNPGVPMEYGAMAVHHLTDADVADCPAASTFRLPDDAEFVIGHHVDFDWEVALRCGPQPPMKRICTWALARYCWPHLDSHRQTALLYFLAPDIAKTQARYAHAAAVDVEILSAILWHIVAYLGGVETWDALYAISEAARIPTVMPFGKHKGERINEVPPDYRQWLLRQADVDPYLAQALRGHGQGGSLL